MEEQDHTQSAARMCPKGCGFFGHDNYNGFCSKCHQSMQESKNSNEPRMGSTQVAAGTILDSNDSTTGRASPASSSMSSQDNSPQTSSAGVTADESLSTSGSSDSAAKKHPRCKMCNKRVGLTGFTCRCGGLFCTVHRYSDTHGCKFDYRESGQADIRKANPQVICSKINKI
ncbi:hypothetical protein Aperf_G00000068767 [Anoplocephala perfoliata]